MGWLYFITLTSAFKKINFFQGNDSWLLDRLAIGEIVPLYRE